MLGTDYGGDLVAIETSAEDPVPVSKASQMVGDYIRRLGEIWVEGQIAQLRKRRSMAWITLRDADAEVSIPVFTNLSRLHSGSGEIAEGARVVVLVKPDYFRKQGQLQWRASEFRAVGIGALLARVEELKRSLANEGLFAAERKRPLPFLPRRIGLICGRGSAARHDVEQNSKRRWPGVRFEVREVAVQGVKSIMEVTAALADLEGHPEVEVIVIARGGGSTEDLLPFSGETLVRAVSECRTPVVSAIGHEEDSPILDLVADVRASTPTDAAKRIVPDVAVEATDLARITRRLRHSTAQRITNERQRLDHLLTRPVMTRPSAVITYQRERLSDQRNRARHAFSRLVRHESSRQEAVARHRQQLNPATIVVAERTRVAELAGRSSNAITNLLSAHRERLDVTQARIRALSPQATLDRGYAVVRLSGGQLLRSSDAVEIGDTVNARLANGSVQSVVTGREPGEPHSEVPRAQPSPKIPREDS